MVWLTLLLVAVVNPVRGADAGSRPYDDRFVWVFGWGLGNDADVTAITRLIEAAGQHGINGAMMSFGLDTLCRRDADYFRRLDSIKAACNRARIDLIPAVFSVGYGGGILSHDRNLAEGVLVTNAPFVARGDRARFEPNPSTGVKLSNGGFEDCQGNRFPGFGFHDQPGEVSFADQEVRHQGRCALRLEHFTANPHGHGRVNQEIRVIPRRCYRVSLWVKTEGLTPANSFRMLVLSGDRNLGPREFNLPATTDWRKLTLVFNSLNLDRVVLYAGVWDGQAGRVWIDDWTIEEIGPVNVLRRPGTPVAVRGVDGGTAYVEGQDYAPLEDPNLNPYRVDGESVGLRLLPGTRIREGERLNVSWYHSMLIHDSQVPVCMGEAAIYEIMDHEMKRIAEHLQPRRIMLNMDEVRMGGTCQACAGRNLGELLGECLTRQVQIVRRYAPDAMVYAWSDMLDPQHNARAGYYLSEGDFAGSWDHVPRDLVIAVWGGAPREESLQFFAGKGFRTLVACYYDADDLRETTDWIRVARPISGVRGFMYTPWTGKYALLPAFGDLLRGR